MQKTSKSTSDARQPQIWKRHRKKQHPHEDILPGKVQAFAGAITEILCHIMSKVGLGIARRDYSLHFPAIARLASSADFLA
jgi:hypothetical protein